MGQRLRGMILVLVLLAAGALLGSAVSQWWHPLEEDSSTREILFSHRVRVEVLNGGGESGMAREATGVLRDLGLDVVYYGNAETFSQDPSVVVDRVGRLEDARKLADALGIPDVRSEPDSNLYVDFTVRLGPEWEDPALAGIEEAPPVPWWDLRRFFRHDQEDERGGEPDSPDGEPDSIGLLINGEKAAS